MPVAIRRRTAIFSGLAAGALAAPTMFRGAAAQGLRCDDCGSRIVVPFAPGGTTDIIASVVAQILTESTGSTFVTDNRAGSNGNVSAEIVARASPDGRTLLLGHVGTAVTNQYLHKYIPYDSVESFAPVALIGEVPNVLAVHSTFPCKSLAEFVDYCRAQGPGQVAYGSPAVGSAGHLAMEYLQSVTGIKLAHISYRGRSRMIRDLLAGRLLVVMDNLPTYAPYIQSGILRGLAVTSIKRWFTAPAIPTVAEQGYDGFNSTFWWYLAAPAGMRLDLVRKLSDAIVEGMKSEARVKRMRAFGVLEQPRCSEDLANHIASEHAKWKNVISFAGLTPH